MEHRDRKGREIHLGDTVCVVRGEWKGVCGCVAGFDDALGYATAEFRVTHLARRPAKAVKDEKISVGDAFSDRLDYLQIQ